MLYISDIKDNGNTLYVTDTADGVTEKISNKGLFNLVRNKDRSKRVEVYGATSVWNGRAEPVIVLYPQPVDRVVLTHKLNEVNKTRNPWTEAKVTDYIASLKVGTEIKIRYKSRGSDGVMHSGEGAVKRISDDKWLCVDRDRVFPFCQGNVGVSSSFAADLVMLCWAEHVVDFSCL